MYFRPSEAILRFNLLKSCERVNRARSARYRAGVWDMEISGTRLQSGVGWCRRRKHNLREYTRKQAGVLLPRLIRPPSIVVAHSVSRRTSRFALVVRPSLIISAFLLVLFFFVFLSTTSATIAEVAAAAFPRRRVLFFVCVNVVCVFHR